MLAKPITVSAALDHYYDEHVLIKVTDFPRQLIIIGHLKAFFHDTLLSDIDIPACRAYGDARLGGMSGAIGRGSRRRCTSPGTIRREINALKAAANHALKWKRISIREMPTFELPSEHTSSRVQMLTREQLHQALARCAEHCERSSDPSERQKYEHLCAFILIAYHTGARRRSITHMKTAQIDLRCNSLDLHPAGARLTKKRRPTLPIYRPIRPIIEHLMASSKTTYLFDKPRDLYRPFVKLMAELGVEAHPHMLRHSRASHMLMDGENPYKVARILGDSLATVERVYAHCTVGYLDTDSEL